MNTEIQDCHPTTSEPGCSLSRLCSEAVALSARLKIGMQLDRAETNRLLRTLENLASNVAGCTVMQAQLRSILARKDWLLISVSAASPEATRMTGVQIGIIQGKTPKLRTRQSPMQKWQQRNGLGRR